MSCEQTTHDLERQAAPGDEHYLVWVTLTTDKNGVTKPCGRECYKCRDTRRRYYPELKSQQELVDKIEDKDEQVIFLERRGKRVTGEDKNTKNINVKTSVDVKKEEAVSDECYKKYKQKSIEAPNISIIC